MFSCEFCEIFKNTFFHRTPPVAASVITVIITDEVVLTKLKRPTLTRILQFYNLTTLLDLGPFVQLKKREKYPWMSVTLLKVTLLHEYFHIFHLCKWYQIAQSITNESGDTNLSMLNQMVTRPLLMTIMVKNRLGFCDILIILPLGLIKCAILRLPH